MFHSSSFSKASLCLSETIFFASLFLLCLHRSFYSYYCCVNWISRFLKFNFLTRFFPRSAQTLASLRSLCLSLEKFTLVFFPREVGGSSGHTREHLSVGLHGQIFLKLPETNKQVSRRKKNPWTEKFVFIGNMWKKILKMLVYEK